MEDWRKGWLEFERMTSEEIRAKEEAEKKADIVSSLESLIEALGPESVAKLDEAAKVLRGIGLDVSGCGCCGSPNFGTAPWHGAIENFSFQFWLDFRKENSL